MYMYTVCINEPNIYTLMLSYSQNFASNFQKSCRKYLKYFCDIFVPSICISNWNKHVDALNACSLETFCASGYIYDLRMFLQHLLQIPKRLFVALSYTKLLLARYYALGKFWYTDSNACIALLFFLNLGNNIYCLIRVCRFNISIMKSTINYQNNIHLDSLHKILSFGVNI